MRKKFIPIIGAISAGKSTFLQGLLGTNVFETGSTTTTKFVCLIKNSKQTKFYHVKPKEGEVDFVKEGEETIGEDNIKKKIEEVNSDLSKVKATKENIFYMLEIPIKGIENDSLLEQCYFMDIPGLNEESSSYIDIIFSYLKLDDIIFEIIIFDSTNIGSVNIINIINKLEEKNCLKKSGNLFILNKIDMIEEKTIGQFKQEFYQNFERDRSIFNISENYFLPINSLLLLAETKFQEDFYSLLFIEFCNYLNPFNIKFESFQDYIVKKIEFTSKWLKARNLNINLEDNICERDKKEIENCIEKITNYKNKIKKECAIRTEVGDLVKLFLLHKSKNIFLDFPKYKDSLQKILQKICINNNIENQILNDNQQKDEYTNQMYNKLNELDTFLSETFKIIDPTNELEQYKSSLKSIREDIMGRKIRIALIGNMNVGKTTLLNCLIGKNVLPTDSQENTHRGIILRHKPGEDFKLFKTKLVKKGSGSNEYSYFEDDKSPYREGIEEIKNYINIKNNDKNINDNDAYLVVTGNLKIFDIIELDEIDKDIISKVEFVDLPAMDRKDNEFDKYYGQILQFSNCCIYINDPMTINDENNVENMRKQYNEDIKKVHILQRHKFMKTCIFLINKSDGLNDEKEKKKAKNNFLNIISNLEKNVKENDINISFFSAKNFFEYLNIKDKYINRLIEEQENLFLELYEEFNLKFKYLSYDFKKFVLDKISGIEENSIFKQSKENKDIPENFKINLKKVMEKLEKNKYKLFNNDNEYDDVIKQLYNFYSKFKNIDISEALLFFNNLKYSLESSKKLYDENIQKNLTSFFKCTDILFRKELKKNTELKKVNKSKELDILIKDTKEKIKKSFEKTKDKIKDFLANKKNEIKNLINSEIKNISEKLRKANNDIDIAKEALQNEINKIIEEIKNEINNLISKLIKEIIEDIQGIDSLFMQENNNNIQISNIETYNGFANNVFASFFTSTMLSLGGVSITEALTAGLGAAASGIFGGPLCIIIALGVGLGAGLTTFLIKYFRKEKRYKDGLEDYLEKIKEKLKNFEDDSLDALRLIEEDFDNKLKVVIELMKKDIDNLDKENWKDIKEKYIIQKQKLYFLIPSLKE